MRVAPCGLIVASAFPSLSPDEQSHLAFQLGCSAAAITHTHPSGWLSSGFLSALILRILLGTYLFILLSAPPVENHERLKLLRCHDNEGRS